MTTEVRPPFDVRGMRVGIFIIAYNAASHIEGTLKRIPDDIWGAVHRVYVVDDCSSDETVAKTLQLRESYPELHVIRNKVNRRYGGNQKIGYQYALDNELDAVVMLHADGQYAPESLADILQPIVEGQADVVFGSRMLQPGNALKGGMPRYKYVGNRILTSVQNYLCGMKLSEFHSGYRAYSSKFLRNVPFWENTDEWHFDTQILLQAQQAGARIMEVPIPTYYGDEICHVNGVAYALHCVMTSMKYRLHRRNIVYSRIFDLNLKGRRYFGKFDDPYSSHSIILKKLHALGPLEERTVLELGVGDASLTQRLQAEGALVDALEIEQEAADIADPFCRNMFVADLDSIGELELSSSYDVILAADILEHLVDPETVLSRLKKYAGPDTVLIISLPNIANIYVRLNLLFGRLPLHSKGILDRTHLHHYTLSMAEEMFKRTGWIVEQRAVTAIPLGIVFPVLLTRPLRWIYALFYSITKLMKGLFAYQGVWVCKNPNSARLL